MQADSHADSRDTWLRASRAVLEVVIGGSYAAFLLAHVWLAASTESHLAQLAVALIVGLPLASNFLARQLSWGLTEQRRWSAATVLLLSLALVLQGSASTAQRALVVLTFLLCSLLAQYRRTEPEREAWRDRAAAWLLALAPAQVLCAMAAAPSSAWLLHLPLVIAAVCAGALIQSARFTSSAVHARSPRRLQRELAHRPVEGASSRERLRAAAPLTAAMIGLTALSYVLLAALPRPDLRPAAPDAGAQGSTEVTSPAAAGSGETARVFGEELVPGGALSEERQEVVMTVRARRSPDALAPGEFVGSLYLRGAVLDTFSDTTLRAGSQSTPQPRRDEEDGERDGWTRLADSGGLEPLWLDIEQQSFRSRGGTWEVLFAPQPALAVRLPQVHFDPDGLLALRQGAGPATLSYELQAPLRRRRPARATARSGSPGERYLQLPPPSAELEQLARIAAERTGSATTDLERVEALLEYFAREYRYSLRTQDVPGIEGIASFVRRGKGHCTSFAATSVLMLRTLGLPARVATGFLAQEYSRERQRYLVTNKNGHAWIEVHFAGAGWVAFDPTPKRARELALSAASSGDEDDLGAWWSELRGDLAAWSESGAAQIELDLLLATLVDGPRALWVSAERAPLPSAALVLVGLGLLAVLRQRRRRVRQARLPMGGPPPPTALTEELLDVLERAGYVRRPGETLLELAKRVTEQRPDPELIRAVDALYLQRFGGRATPTASELRELRSWISQRAAQLASEA